MAGKHKHCHFPPCAQILSICCCVQTDTLKSTYILAEKMTAGGFALSTAITCKVSGPELPLMMSKASSKQHTHACTQQTSQPSMHCHMCSSCLRQALGYRHTSALNKPVSIQCSACHLCSCCPRQATSNRHTSVISHLASILCVATCGVCQTCFPWPSRPAARFDVSTTLLISLQLGLGTTLQLLVGQLACSC